jgi:choline monooxygenase
MLTPEAGRNPLEIDRDPSRARSLPAWAYRDPRLFEQEARTIMRRGWHYAGAAAELREPGAYLTARLLDQSVIVIRGRDGALRGFHNVCRHRGHELLQGRGSAAVVVCPYHAWSYHADGRLRSARGAEKQPDFDPGRYGLKPMRVEIFARHFVFFCLDQQAKPLAEQAPGLASELEAEVADFAALVPRPELPSAEIRCNWKVAVDNYLECYHCRAAHPAFADMVAMPSYRIATHGPWVSHKAALRRGDNRAYPVAPDAAQQQALFWWLWPTTTFNVLPGMANISVFSFFPTGVGTTLQWGQNYTLPGAASDAAHTTYRNEILGTEDVLLCESVQRGVASEGYDRGRYVVDGSDGEGSEAAVHHFHRLVADALAQ